MIGLSVVYKAFENMGGFTRVLGWQPDSRAAVLIFGLFHGLGLATKLQDLTLSPNGLVGNIISFNVGVEIGQMLALTLVLLAADVLAPERELHATRVRRERRADERRIPAGRLPARRLPSRARDERPRDSQPVPSVRRLVIATAAACAVAMVILVAAVLPAEYGVDPLGTGSALGLLRAEPADALPAAGADGTRWRRSRAVHRRSTARRIAPIPSSSNSGLYEYPR